MTIDAIPKEARERGLWCLWKREKRGDNITKVPYQANGDKAKASDQETFTSFDKAVAAYKNGGYSGLGLGIFNGFCAVDIDHCIDHDAPGGSKISDMAQDIINTMDSYTEMSPSCTGIRILFKAKGFQYDKSKYYINNQKRGLEVYIEGATKKYVTVTGMPWGKWGQKPVAERGEQIARVLEKYMRRQEPKPVQPAYTRLSAPDYLKRGLDVDKRLRALWDGHRDTTDESGNDLALFNKLACWCNKDEALMIEAFLRSPYAEQKDDAHKKKLQREDYLHSTAQMAIAGCQKTAAELDEEYKARRAIQAFGNSPSVGQYIDEDIKPVLARASDVPYEPPRFLVAPYFQKGKGNMIQADPGMGKTAFMCAIAATVSAGKPLLGVPITDPGNVLILSVEDDLPVLRGRIEASGGNLDNCYFMTNAAGMRFNSPEVERAIKDIEAVMVIFDPFQAFLGADVDMFRANEIRPELSKLFEMCERNDCACAIIAHMSKGSRDNSAVNRALGSVDIPAAMRSIIQIIRNPDNEDECIAVHIKSSNAPKGRSIAYQIGERGGVTWNGFHPMTEADLYTITKRKEKGVPYENEPLVKVFNQLIADRPGGGFWSYADVKAIGMKICGFPPFADVSDLKAKLNRGLAKELQEHDGLIVTCGHRDKHARGLRIEQYEHPQAYQTKISQG